MKRARDERDAAPVGNYQRYYGYRGAPADDGPEAVTSAAMSDAAEGDVHDATPEWHHAAETSPAISCQRPEGAFNEVHSPRSRKQRTRIPSMASSPANA